MRYGPWIIGLVLAITPQLQAQTPATQPASIAVILKTQDEDFFWSPLRKGIRAAAEANQVQVEILGPKLEDDREQAQLIKEVTHRGIKSIALAAINDRYLTPAVETAVARGAEIITVDSSVHSNKIKSFVGSDNFQIGMAAGELLAKSLSGKGRILMMRYLPGCPSTTRRERGFLAYCEDHPQLVIVSSKINGGTTAAETQEIARRSLEAFRDEKGKLALDGIFCPNLQTTVGMLHYLKTIGAAGQVKFVGTDVSTELLQALRAGEIEGLLAQNPYEMGYQCVQKLLELRAGKPVDIRVMTSLKALTRENLEAPENRRFIAP